VTREPASAYPRSSVRVRPSVRGAYECRRTRDVDVDGGYRGSGGVVVWGAVSPPRACTAERET